MLQRHLGTIVTAVEAACRDHRGALAEVMAEAVVKAYLQAKTKQIEVSSALHLIAVELDAKELIETATQRGEEAIAAMLSIASDGRFDNPHVVARNWSPRIPSWYLYYASRRHTPAALRAFLDFIRRQGHSDRTGSGQTGASSRS